MKKIFRVIGEAWENVENFGDLFEFTIGVLWVLVISIGLFLFGLLLGIGSFEILKFIF